MPLHLVRTPLMPISTKSEDTQKQVYIYFDGKVRDQVVVENGIVVLAAPVFQWMIGQKWEDIE